MHMPSDETEQALQARIAQLRAELSSLEGRLPAAPPRVRFRSAGCGNPAQPAPLRARPPARADETPLPIAAG